MAGRETLVNVSHFLCIKDRQFNEITGKLLWLWRSPIFPLIPAPGQVTHHWKYKWPKFLRVLDFSEGEGDHVGEEHDWGDVTDQAENLQGRERLLRKCAAGIFLHKDQLELPQCDTELWVHVCHFIWWILLPWCIENVLLKTQIKECVERQKTPSLGFL